MGLQRRPGFAGRRRRHLDRALGLVGALEVRRGAHRPRIETAAAAGIHWLLAVQNDDGGWPTFRRGSRGEHCSTAAAPI